MEQDLALCASNCAARGNPHRLGGRNRSGLGVKRVTAIADSRRHRLVGLDFRAASRTGLVFGHLGRLCPHERGTGCNRIRDRLSRWHFIGGLIGWYSAMEDFCDGVINFLRAVPMTAWVPFAVFLFGIHESAAIFLIAFGSFFPIVVNVAAGARQTPRTLIRAARMLGTPPRKLLLRVVLPAALPGDLHWPSSWTRFGVGACDRCRDARRAGWSRLRALVCLPVQPA